MMHIRRIYTHNFTRLKSLRTGYMGEGSYGRRKRAGRDYVREIKVGQPKYNNLAWERFREKRTAFCDLKSNEEWNERRLGSGSLFINVARDDESALSKTVCLYTLLLHFLRHVGVSANNRIRKYLAPGEREGRVGIIELTINPAHFRANGYSWFIFGEWSVARKKRAARSPG